MAFTGGPLSVIGIVPSYTSNLGQQTSASGVVQAQNQVWQGVGQSFIGRPGQPMTGNLTGSPINIALNSDATQGISSGGIPLNSGNNVLAPSLTKFLSGPQAFSVNNQIGNSLQSAGPFGSVLSGGGSNLLGGGTGFGGGGFGGGAGFGALAGGLVGAANYIMFPGAGGESGSNYSGLPYNLKDVTFSLQPANRGPQAYGSAAAVTNPTTSTTLPFNAYTSMPPLAGSPTANALKSSAMVGGLSQNAFSSSLSSKNFNTSIPRLV